MGTVALSAFHPLVAPHAINCPAFQVDDAVLGAAREFAELVGLYYETVAVTTVNQPVLGTYALTPTDNTTEPYSIREAWLYGDKLERGDYGFIQSSRSIELSDTPTAEIPNGSLEVSVRLRPKVDAATLPDFFYKDHADLIARGAKARLLLIPNQPWSNVQLGELLRRQFLSECATEQSVQRRREGVFPHRTSAVY